MIGNVGIALPGLSRPVPSAFDVTWRPLSQGLELTVAMEKPGGFELEFRDLRGRSLWSYHGHASKAGYQGVRLPLGSWSGACVLVARSANRRLVMPILVIQ
jgi:hypothetical protein